MCQGLAQACLARARWSMQKHHATRPAVSCSSACAANNVAHGTYRFQVIKLESTPLSEKSMAVCAYESSCPFTPSSYTKLCVRVSYAPTRQSPLRQTTFPTGPETGRRAAATGGK